MSDKILKSGTLTKEFLKLFQAVQEAAHANSKAHGFWDDLEILGRREAFLRGRDDSVRTALVGQKIALMHAELSELLEAYRGKPGESCEKITAISAAEEECADLLIRLLDFCQAFGLRLGLATLLKMEYNAGRPHKHGKRF